MNNQQVIDFLSYLADGRKMQFCKDCKKVVTYKDAIGGESMYFVGGMDSSNGSGEGNRAEDCDIIRKTYVGVDIDIRNHFMKQGELIDQDRLHSEINEIRMKLLIAGLGDYCAIVDTGNGCHIYYRGKGKKFDVVEYSECVKGLMMRIDFALRDLGYTTDHACSNLSRLLRLPGSINPRKKPDKKSMKGFDLGPIECSILYFEKEESDTFNSLDDFREVYLKSKEGEKEIEKEIISQAKEYRKSSDGLWGEINSIDIGDIAYKVWGVTKGKSNGPFTTLVESHKNMGAFIINQSNIIKNQGSSLIITDRDVFTSFDIICYEMMGGNTKDTLQWFVDNYGIDPSKYSKSVEKVKRGRKFNNIGYKYPGQAMCDEFGSIKSGEIVLIAAYTNVGKTSFGVSLLRENLNKKVGLINMEFDIEDTYRFQFLRSKGFKDNELKAVGTDLRPIDDALKSEIDSFVHKRLSEIPTSPMGQDSTIDELIEKLDSMIYDGYSMIMIDSLSSIKGGDTNEGQVLIMKYLRNYATETGVTLLLIHHFNKGGKSESGSQKIADLCNVVINIFHAESGPGRKYRVFVLKKDKAHSDRVLFHGVQAIEGGYKKVDEWDRETDKPEWTGK